MDERETVTTDAAATLAGVSEQTIRRWIRYGYLKASRVTPQRGGWRIDKQDLLLKLGKTDGKEG